MDSMSGDETGSRAHGDKLSRESQPKKGAFSGGNGRAQHNRGDGHTRATSLTAKAEEGGKRSGKGTSGSNGSYTATQDTALSSKGRHKQHWAQ